MASLTPCSNCASMILSHRVCPFCGFYKGKPVVEIKVKVSRKEKERAAQASSQQ